MGSVLTCSKMMVTNWISLYTLGKGPWQGQHQSWIMFFLLLKTRKIVKSKQNCQSIKVFVSGVKVKHVRMSANFNWSLARDEPWLPWSTDTQLCHPSPQTIPVFPCNAIERRKNLLFQIGTATLLWVKIERRKKICWTGKTICWQCLDAKRTVVLSTFAVN